MRPAEQRGDQRRGEVHRIMDQNVGVEVAGRRQLVVEPGDETLTGETRPTMNARCSAAAATTTTAAGAASTFIGLALVGVSLLDAYRRPVDEQPRQRR